MYNIKKNSSRKDCCKYSKASHFKKKQNTTYFQRNKYNKYKSIYNHSNKFSNNSYEYEYENNSFFEKESENNNNGSKKKKELIEINENKYMYEDENKENSSLYENSTVHELPIQEKTNEKSCEKNNNEEDKSEPDLNDSESNNTIILPNTNSYCKTNSQICSEDKENIEPNIQYSNNNCNSVNISNDYFNKKLSSINLSSQDFNEAFYVPKRLNNLYAMYSNNNKINTNERNQYDNNNNNLADSNSSMSLNPSFDFNNIFQNNNNNINNNIQNLDGINLLLNKNNLFCNQKLNINNFPSLDLIHPFNLYDSYNNKTFRKMNSFDSFHSSLKTQISGSFIENERERENTDILEINVKISAKNSLIFKIRRYDDMFKTVKIFCEINKLDTKLIRPFIIYIIKALNSIYGIYNLPLKSEEIRLLKDIKEYFYNNNDNNENNNSFCEENEEKREIERERGNSLNNTNNKIEMNYQEYLKRRNENIKEDLFVNDEYGNNDNEGD